MWRPWVGNAIWTPSKLKSLLSHQKLILLWPVHLFPSLSCLEIESVTQAFVTHCRTLKDLWRHQSLYCWADWKLKLGKSKLNSFVGLLEAVEGTMTTQLYCSLPWKKLTKFRQISQRFLKMLKGQGATGKSLGKQEVDMELKALTSLTEAMERNKLTRGEVSTEEAHSEPLDGEHHCGERFAIYFEVEKWQGLVPTPADRSVPAYIWTDEIIRDHVSRDILEMTQLVVLSPSGCLAFKGKRSLRERYMGDQALEIVTRLEGHWLWAGMEVTITACPIMLMEARHILVKARDFIRKQRIQKLTSPKLTTPSAVPKLKEKTFKAKEPEPQCRKVCWADQYWAKKLEQGYGQCTHTQRIIDEWLESLTNPLSLDTPYSSGEDTEDGPYESAVEPQSVLSDNPSPYEVTDSKWEGDDIVAYDTETSHHMMIADRHWLRRKQWLRREHHEHRHQKDCQARGASLPLFKNSSKEGATTYID